MPLTFQNFFFVQEITARGGEMAIKMAPTAEREEGESERARERDDDKWILFGKRQMVKP